MIHRSDFGRTPSGEAVELYALSEPDAPTVSVMTYGAAVHRCGRDVNVVLGFPTLEGYVAHDGHYFGAVVGRYANRIGGARFTLGGRVHELPRNDGTSSLHGGPRGFDKQVWDAEVDGDRLVLRHVSPDGEMGYPGTLELEVAYALAEGALRVEYRATTDAPTVVNPTNHTCWNLAGEGAGAIDGHVVTIDASAYVPVDAALVPTGEIGFVEGTPFDLRLPAPIGARRYDHTFVVDRDDEASLVRAAVVEEPRSGRRLEVHTTEPGIHLYTGNALDGSLYGTGGCAYGPGDCFALETQHYPDSPNRPGFPSTVLRPGEVFTSTTVFRLSPT